MYPSINLNAKVAWALLLASWLALTTVVQALPEDSLQAIKITADRALRDEKQGLTVYLGNVSMQQGSLSIEADSITIYRIVEEADKIVAEGSPARMRQQPEANQQFVHASANTIEYFKAEDRVHLKQDARIEQDGSTVTGETIDYLITEQVVQATSNAQQAQSRVEVVIPAHTLQQAREKEAANGTTKSE